MAVGKQLLEALPPPSGKECVPQNDKKCNKKLDPVTQFRSSSKIKDSLISLASGQRYQQYLVLFSFAKIFNPFGLSPIEVDFSTRPISEQKKL